VARRVGLGYVLALLLRQNVDQGYTDNIQIFILEGLVTVLIGLASYWMVHDFPDKATFLEPEEKALALRRLKEDNQASAEKEVFKMKVSAMRHKVEKELFKHSMY
jgi:sugar phosphate permease